MSERPELNKESDGTTFRSFYCLKRELVNFGRENELPVLGGKIELTDRIAKERRRNIERIASESDFSGKGNL